MKHLIALVIVSSVLTADLAAASLWVPFALGQQDELNWFYDRDSVAHPQYIYLLGIIPIRDRNYKALWIRTERPGEIRFHVFLDCAAHTAVLYDETGMLYDVPLVDYLYLKPIPPDSVLDKLHMAVCR
jgi:hypothetical protein